MREKIDKLPENILDQEEKYIYESPDGGKTIYRRLMEFDLGQVKDKSIELHDEIIEGLKFQLDKLGKVIDDMKRKLN